MYIVRACLASSDILVGDVAEELHHSWCYSNLSGESKCGSRRIVRIMRKQTAKKGQKPTSQKAQKLKAKLSSVDFGQKFPWKSWICWWIFRWIFPACFSMENGPKNPRKNQTPKFTSNFREGVSLIQTRKTVVNWQKRWKNDRGSFSCLCLAIFSVAIPFELLGLHHTILFVRNQLV